MLNDIKLHGYLGRDPELSWINGQNGQYAKVAFSLGVGRDFGDETDWFYCVMYGKRAEVIDKWLRKGAEIIVSGRMESYRPKNDPNRTAWIVKMSDFNFCGKGNGSGSSNSSSAYSSPAPAAQEAPAPAQAEPQQMEFNDLPDSFEEQEDDIPF